MADGSGPLRSGERRVAAPHPGPMLKRDYVDPLGLDVVEFAHHLGMDAGVLEAMLAGRASIDVGTALRISRALQLPAERIVQMQVRYDFAAARKAPAFAEVGLLQPKETAAFPGQHLCGRLGRSTEGAGFDDSLFFREDLTQRSDDNAYAGLHALWRGDRLRVYDPSGSVLWAGSILSDFDGRMLLPYVPVPTWQGWFAWSYQADLALGSEHAANLANAGAG